MVSLAPDCKGLVTHNTNTWLYIMHYVTFNHGQCLVQQQLSTFQGLQYKKQKDKPYQQMTSRTLQGKF